MAEIENQLQAFDRSKLRSVQTEVKNPLPSSSTLHEELRPDNFSNLPDVSAIAKFDQSQLRSVETNEKIILPCAQTIQEETAQSRSQVKNFDLKKLKPVQTVEKNALPSASTLHEELRPDDYNLPDVSAVAKFDLSKLRSVETKEKMVLPCANTIQQESFESRSYVKNFDLKRLKPVRTQVKNPLPTPGMLRLEMRPAILPDMSEVGLFDRTNLRQTITKEVCFLPCLEAIKEEAFESRAEIKTFDRSRLRSVPSVG